MHANLIGLRDGLVYLIFTQSRANLDLSTIGDPLRWLWTMDYGGWTDGWLVGAGLVNKMMMMIAWNGINRMAMAYRTGGK